MDTASRPGPAQFENRLIRRGGMTSGSSDPEEARIILVDPLRTFPLAAWTDGAFWVFLTDQSLGSCHGPVQ
jgi:hypothetical protein